MTPDCRHTSLQDCDYCREFPAVPPRAPMPDTKGTTDLLTSMHHEAQRTIREQAETIGKLRNENEGLKAQLTEMKRKRRRRA